MEVRQINNTQSHSAEERLLEYVELQIGKMKNHANLNVVDGQPGFYELNAALAEHQTINLGLISMYVIAKTELEKATEAFESWFADKYIEQRELLNPRSISSTKWYSTKEVEMQVRSKYKSDYIRLKQEMVFAEHRVGAVRRLLDSWSAQQYALARLSKNVEAEMSGSGVEDLQF